MKTRELVEVGLGGGIICVLSPFIIPIPFSPIPITMGTLAVSLVAAILGVKKGVIATVVYLLLGLIGVPVFSGFRGGFGVLFGPTGGYLIGYLFLAFFTGFLVQRHSERFVFYPVAISLGMIFCYLFGTIVFVLVSKASFYAAFTACVLPFLPLDIVKIVVASVLGFSIKKRLGKKMAM